MHYLEETAVMNSAFFYQIVPLQKQMYRCSNYQMKEISFEIYKARERAIEKLEDELELAEEALENKYGIDD